MSVLGIDGYLITPYTTNEAGTTTYVGQWGGNTKGTGYFDVQESGAVDSYNIAFGGNISNVVYWGMDFGITHMNYNLTPQWTEDLTYARVGDDYNIIREMPALWNLANFYNCSGTGFNYKLGFIVKPIQELRLGFAFETPTWYSLSQTFGADLNFMYNNDRQNASSVTTNGGLDGYNNVNFRTPWKINASVAAVLINRLIVSAEYEWTQFKGMKYSEPTFGGDYWGYPDGWYYPGDFYPWYSSGTRANMLDPNISSDPYFYANNPIKQIYRNTNTLRLGAEFRVIPQFSVRAGYSFVSSPVKESVNKMPVDIGGTIPNYRFDNTTNYVTCGVGYRIKSFYVDLAYVYKHMSSTYHAFSPFYPPEYNDYDLGMIPSQTSSLSLNNSQIVLSAGFKF